MPVTMKTKALVSRALSFSVGTVDPSIRNPDKNTVNSCTYWLFFRDLKYHN